MRAPRLRLTVGGMMILVLAAGLATWKWVLPWLDRPTIAEQAARARYEQARLTREVAEYALSEYRHGVFKQPSEAVGGELAMARADLARAKDRLEWQRRVGTPAQRRQAERELALSLLDRDEQASIRQADHDKQVHSLRADITRARAAEAARYAAYRAERARRWTSSRLPERPAD